MFHFVPTIRRGGTKKVRLRKVVDMELNDTGIIAEVEVADIETAQVGRILVSGDVLNSPFYLQAMNKDYFLVWEEDVEWL